ncbi:transposase [Kitasatospora sp. NPDC088548]|uniref:transposase n=1 Tax=Kitasatospora sp. NPDC088548 TaxID=3364075 RepID=UPI0038263788
MRLLREAFRYQDPPQRKPFVRDVTSWITRRPDRLRNEDAQQLNGVLARAPALATTAEHVRAFTGRMNDCRGRELKDWIARVQNDQVPALRSFANGLLQDLDAVVASLTQRYSSGAVEATTTNSKCSSARCSAAPASSSWAAPG